MKHNRYNDYTKEPKEHVNKKLVTAWERLPSLSFPETEKFTLQAWLGTQNMGIRVSIRVFMQAILLKDILLWAWNWKAPNQKRVEYQCDLRKKAFWCEIRCGDYFHNIHSSPMKGKLYLICNFWHKYFETIYTIPVITNNCIWFSQFMYQTFFPIKS